jgi:hypothetical protein
MPSYDKWRPSRDVTTIKGSSRVLAKDTQTDDNEIYLDVPTFMRKKGLKEIRKVKTG